MADEWFVKLAGTEQGPISPAQLRELVRKKIVKPDTPLRKGENRWVRAGRVHGLFEAALGDSASMSTSASASGVRGSGGGIGVGFERFGSKKGGSGR